MYNIKELKEDIIKILNKKNIEHVFKEDIIITPLCVITFEDSRLKVIPKNFYCGIFFNFNDKRKTIKYSDTLEAIETELITYQDHEDLKKSTYFT